jgi:hypothetical protein
MMSRLSLPAMLACWLALCGKPSAAATVQDVRIEHATIVSPERESPLGDAAFSGFLAATPTRMASSPNSLAQLALMPGPTPTMSAKSCAEGWVSGPY